MEINLFGHNLNNIIESILIEDDLQQKKTRLSLVAISLKILLNESNAYYEIIKIPEFEVHSLKEMIKKAIEDFSK